MRWVLARLLPKGAAEAACDAHRPPSPLPPSKLLVFDSAGVSRAFGAEYVAFHSFESRSFRVSSAAFAARVQHSGLEASLCLQTKQLLRGANAAFKTRATGYGLRLT